MSEIDLVSIETLISKHLAEFAIRREVLEAQLEKLIADEKAFKEMIRRLITDKKRSTELEDPNPSSKKEVDQGNALSPSRKRADRRTILDASMSVLMRTGRPMSRTEIKIAIESAFPDEFQNLKLESMYPFLREIGRRSGFIFDSKRKTYHYVGEKVAA